MRMQNVLGFVALVALAGFSGSGITAQSQPARGTGQARGAARGGARAQAAAGPYSCLLTLTITGNGTSNSQGNGNCPPGGKVTVAVVNASTTDTYTVTINPTADFFTTAAKTQTARILNPPAAQSVTLGPGDSDAMKFVVRPAGDFGGRGGLPRPNKYRYRFQVSGSFGSVYVDPDFDVP